MRTIVLATAILLFWANALIGQGMTRYQFYVSEHYYKIMDKGVDSLNALNPNSVVKMYDDFSWFNYNLPPDNDSIAEWSGSYIPEDSLGRRIYTINLRSHGSGLSDDIKAKIKSRQFNFAYLYTTSFNDVGNYLKNQQFLVEMDVGELYGSTKNDNSFPMLSKVLTRKITILSTPFTCQHLYKMHRIKKFQNLVSLNIRHWRNLSYKDLTFVKKLKNLVHFRSPLELPETLKVCPTNLQELEVYKLDNCDLEQEDWADDLLRLKKLKKIYIFSAELSLEEWGRLFGVLDKISGFEQIIIGESWRFSPEEFKEMYPNNKYVTKSFRYTGSNPERW
jgi:hypothetical protein